MPLNKLNHIQIQATEEILILPAKGPSKAQLWKPSTHKPCTSEPENCSLTCHPNAGRRRWGDGDAPGIPSAGQDPQRHQQAAQDPLFDLP